MDLASRIRKAIIRVEEELAKADLSSDQRLQLQILLNLLKEQNLNENSRSTTRQTR